MKSFFQFFIACESVISECECITSDRMWCLEHRKICTITCDFLSRLYFSRYHSWFHHSWYVFRCENCEDYATFISNSICYQLYSLFTQHFQAMKAKSISLILAFFYLSHWTLESQNEQTKKSLHYTNNREEETEESSGRFLQYNFGSWWCKK